MYNYSGRFKKIPEPNGSGIFLGSMSIVGVAHKMKPHG